MLGIQIGFLPIRLLDILDILIVGYLFFQIYKLLKGSIAFNIFIGVVAAFILWQLVKLLHMELTSAVFEQFASVGVIMLLIVFQPELRRFLLFLGNSTLRQRYNFFDRWLGEDSENNTSEIQQKTQTIKAALLRLAESKTGALIVFAKSFQMTKLNNTGVKLDADISQQLLESIFNKKSPLHDGAVIIGGGKIQQASAVLPISSKTNLPKSLGLRHRAAIGATEGSEVTVFIVSEETGKISVANKGRLNQNVSDTELTELLLEHYQ